MILFQSIIAAIIPAVIYTTLIYYVDRYEKEPLWLLAATFFWGAVPAIIFALIFNGVLGLPFYLLLGDWGACVDCAADYNAADQVDATDLAMLLGGWS